MSSIHDSSTPSSPSLVSLGSSRVPSPFDLTVIVDQSKDSELGAKLAKETVHPTYYFEDGNVVFKVEETLYNVHRYFFLRDSPHFRTILQGADGSNPHILSGVNCADFDEFLAILYPIDFRRPTKKTTAQWTLILHLAAKWDFENIKLLAIDSLTTNADPVDKIVLGRRYAISDWLPGAYKAVCMRADPLSVEEGMKLGVEDAVRISAARQLYGTGKARYEAEYLVGDLGEIFQLEQSSEGRVSSAELQEDPIKILEEQVAEALVEYLATPTPAKGPCHNTMTTRHGICISSGPCGFSRSCDSCKQESDEQRVLKGERKQRLEDLKSKLGKRRKGSVGRLGRVASFR